MRPLLALAASLAGCVQTVWLEDPAPAATVGEACEVGTPETFSLEVTFPARDASCPWGEGDNREAEQALVTARVEETVALDLADAAICALAFDFSDTSADTGDDDDEQRLRYDDGFLLTFDDAVLAASYAPLVEALPADGFVRLYDWDRLVGFPFGFEEGGTYCLGAEEGLSTCSVPPPETPGVIDLSFGDVVVEALAERAHAEQRYTFGFITYGDNDEGMDCSHNTFSFTVDVTSVPY